MQNINQHLKERLSERYQIDINDIEYERLNGMAKITNPFSTSKNNTSCDYRNIKFNEINIICIFNFKVNRIITVLNDAKYFGPGAKVKGKLSYKTKYGYYILIYDKFKAILHSSEIKEELIENKIYDFVILFNRIDKKINQRRTFLRLK